MKKGYKRLLIFSVTLICILLINSFIFNIFSRYGLILFLIILLGIFNAIFVIERNKNRYFKDILFEIFMYVMTFFILYYLSGLFIGLARVPNYFTFIGIKNYILPITLNCILVEIFRYNMLCKAEGNKVCTTIVIILFILFNVTNEYYYAVFNSQYDVLKFIALTLLPAISKNISYSFITKKVGYKSVIIFDLIFSLYRYLLPIVPNFNEYLTSLIYLLVPVLFAFRIFKFSLRKKDLDIPSDYYKKKLIGPMIPALIVLVLVYFYSGYFRFYTVAIASGSMTPNIKKGDVVIVDQKFSFNDLKEGQVIAYRKSNIIVVHRIVKKVKFGDSYLYYTKGDANNNMDDFVIEEDMIVGAVDYKIPFIGYPTVWLSER